MFCAEKNHNFLEAQIKSQTQEFISTQWGGGGLGRHNTGMI